jgi:titin
MRFLPIALVLIGATLLSSGETSAAPPIVVNSAGDPGNGVCDTSECTLREAIDLANTQPGFDEIDFNIPGAGPHVITSSSAQSLGFIQEPALIDATTQAGYVGSPVVELRAAPGGTDLGLEVGADDVTIRGFAVGGFDTGIHIFVASGEIIEANYIGTDVTGTVARPNTIGILLNGSTGAVIGGDSANARNVISGNHAGIVIQGQATNNSILGNYIGVNASGTSAIGNERGVSIFFTGGNTIGGSTPGTSNVISGNTQFGIEIEFGDGNGIFGNLIGTDPSGQVDIGNEYGIVIGGDGANQVGSGTAGGRNVISGNLKGVSLFSSGNSVQGNYIGINKTGSVPLSNGQAGVEIVFATDNVVGGASPGAGNVISGNGTGVSIIGDRNKVLGNTIGPDASATTAFGYQGVGVEVQGNENEIGGSVAGAGNVIGGNAGEGVLLEGTHNRVQGNWIGTTPTGTSLVNSHGVAALLSGNLIGGTGAGEANVIAHNGNNGVEGFPTEIRANSIHSNGSQGISNDAGSPPPPVITAAGSASGTACAGCTIDIFSDGEDEGRVYHGSTVADGAGNWIFSGSVVGPNITATATQFSQLTNEFATSEFSAPFACSACPPAEAVGGYVEILASDDSREPAVLVWFAAMSVLGALMLGSGLVWRRRR